MNFDKRGEMAFKGLTLGAAIGGFILLIILGSVLQETWPELQTALANLSGASGMGLTGILGGSIIGIIIVAAFLFAVFKVVGLQIGK